MDHSFVYDVSWSAVYEGYDTRHRALGFARDSSGKIYLSDQSITSATRGDGGVYTCGNGREQDEPRVRRPKDRYLDIAF